MGATQSAINSSRAQRRPGANQQPDKAGENVRRRIQLLEELCSANQADRRAEVLQQLAGSHSAGDSIECPNVLNYRPPEFQPGRLIAAGSYGRVYAGTYDGQPAALKLLLLDEETAHAILNEVRLALKLNHSNLVQLLDCAVIATNQPSAASVGQAPGSPGLDIAGQHHQVLPLFGSSSSPAASSASCPYSYLPIVSGQAAFSGPLVPAGEQPDCIGSTASWQSPVTPEPLQHDSRPPTALTTSLGHACFEVWIAMELCDGGTLAQQLQMGFHCLPGSQQVDMEHLLQVGLDVARALSYMHRENVVHGDLKTENVLLKTLSPASAADMQRMCSSCGSSSGHEECSWLTMLCSSSLTSNSHVSRCRSCSGDSCWSCYCRAAGCVDPNGSSSVDTSSSSSSNGSGPNAERRSRRSGFKGSHLLSGLCCIGSPTSCATEDDLYDVAAEEPMPGCLSCGCGVMTLEADAHSHGYNATAQQQPADPQQEDPAHSPSGHCSASVPVDSGALSYDLLGPEYAAFAAGAVAPMDPLPGLFQPAPEMVPLLDASHEQQQQCLLLPLQSQLQPPRGRMHDPYRQHDSSAAMEEFHEEEHVAPLSLYTQARQRRRSRCLHPGVGMPPALAAAAAAAAASAAAASDLSVGHPSGSSSGGGSSSTSGGSDDEAASGHSRSNALQALPRRRSLDSASVPARLSGDLSVSGASTSSSRQQDAAGSCGSSWQEAAVAGQGSSAAAPVCLDVYAHSMVLPPVARRARRHSYCYGTAASYGTSLLTFSKAGAGGVRGQAPPPGGISATEAATAIAAAAEAVRHDSTRAPGEHQRGHRSRRMSWDDRLLRQQSPACSGLGSFFGAALPGLSRLGAEAGAGAWQAQQQAGAAGASSVQSSSSRRTRRHSWAGYLQPDMAAAGVGFGCGLPFGGSYAAAAQQQQQQPLLTQHSIGSDSLAAMHSGYSSLGVAACGKAGRKARRHSWAHYGSEVGAALAPGKFSGLRVWSSCFAAADAAAQHAEADSSYGSVKASSQRHYHPEAPDQPMLRRSASGSVMVGAHGADCLLMSSGEAEGAAAVGCFGKWCSSCTSSSTPSSGGSALHKSRRRYSWCCATGSEAEFWADLNRVDSCSQVGLLARGNELSVPLLPDAGGQEGKSGRQRRCSWDGFRSRNRASSNRGRKAASLDAHISTSDSWRSQQPSGADTPSSCNPPPSQSSNGVAEQAARLPGQSAVLLHNLSSGSGPSFGAGGSQEQFNSLQEACSSTSAASTDASTPVRPIRSSAALPAGTGTGGATLKLDQWLSAPNVCVAVPPSGVTATRARVSFDAPRQAPLSAALTAQADAPSPVVPQQQQLQHQEALGVPFAADSTRVQGGSAVQQPPPCGGQQQLPPAAVSTAAPLAGVAAAAGSVAMVTTRQVTVQDLLTLGSSSTLLTSQPEPTTAFAAAVDGGSGLPGSGAAVEAAPEDEAAALEPFTGTFALRRSTSRAAGEYESWDPATGSGSKCGGGGRGRRWSTGVAAHQILMRKQLLDAHDGDAVAGGLAQQAGFAGSAGLQGLCMPANGGAQPPQHQHQLQHQQQQAPATQEPTSGGRWSLPMDDYMPRRPATAVARTGSGSSGGGSTNHQGKAASSTDTSAVVNVLGMPRQRSAVMSQRRMSYDTAAGAYHVVSQQCNQLVLSDLVQPQLQQGSLPQLAPLQPAASVAQQQSALGAACVGVEDLHPTSDVYKTPGASPKSPSNEPTAKDEQLQQHCHAQMQRLLDALAKKGYGGLHDSAEAAGNSNTSQQPAAEEAAHTSPPAATPQQQAQVVHDVAPLPPRRFCAKVCDFGFSKCLRAGQSHCSTASAGTITHQAPEVLRHGHLSPAADVYAFGIIMWELLTRDRPFRGLLEGDLVVGVCDKGLRPTFPPGCPASFVALAQQCWSDDPTQRPTAAQLVKRLNELLYEERRARLRASAGMAPPPVTHSDTCRRRRHSMPVSGNVRQRRRSRRMSLFLLPFTRQPVVPEDAPLDQQMDEEQDNNPSISRGCAAAVRSARNSGGHASCHAASSSAEHPRRSGSLHGASSVLNSGHSSAAAAGGGTGECASASSNSNVVMSAGGLLASSSTLSRLKGAGGVSGSRGMSAPALVVQAGAAGAAAGDGTEWFQSF